MKLHRANRQPDWADVDRGHRNVWQKLAAGSGGLLTPGNAVTLAGIAIVAAGLAAVGHGWYWQGLLLLAAGRLCDLLDGWLAERTGTKSPLGEAFDALADKVETAAAAIVAVAAGLLPWPLALAVFLPHAAVGAVAATVFATSTRLHPSRLGKLAMAGLWAGLLLFVAARLTGLAAGICAVAAVAVSLVSALAACMVAVGYGRQLRR